ncbi:MULTISPECIES: TolC family protein [unclassified Janthinobacterium]|uniref:TolC family protein n=1 Tax=unclassified Janthinobacterium TaxID=2610881 RepID=UPI0018C9E241|nr:TolC family protein [Janthinobacterium sp. CG_23.4]MDH6158263.1 outer membrane protein TolC [Janthinobacterium sp. CG_23.4]
MRARAMALLLVAAGAQAAPDTLYALPPEAQVRRVLASLPSLRQGALNTQLAGAERDKLIAGPYEWTLRAGASGRRAPGGERYLEQEMALERPLRWFGKAGQDQALGEQGLAVARALYADAWHEAGRALLRDWFDALGELAGVARLEEQLAVTQQLQAAAARRLRAGDGAALELLQADTEQQRVLALLQQARQRSEQPLTLLAVSYPGLPLPQDAALPLPLPQASTGSDSVPAWVERIAHDNHELQLAQAEADLYAMRASRLASDAMPDPTLALRAARERDGQERVFGVSLSFPLPGAGRAADKSGAAIKASMARERLAQTQLRVTLAARRAASDSVHSHAIWATLQQVQQQTIGQAELMQRAYQAGEGTLSAALAGRRLALDAALAAQTAQIEALAAQARLQLDAHAIWSID